MTTKVATFLAHSIAMENEAAERYDELASVMEVHNNPEVAVLFHQMAEFSRRHTASVKSRAVGYQLPQLKSWEYRWNTPEPPEVGVTDATHYMMTPYHALEFALANERRGHDFYAREAAGSDDSEVRRLATEMAEEEAEHVEELEAWIARTPKPATDWKEDPDPVSVID
ncbi:MAG: ferritin family protein [Magnetospirillum sp.]|nr:ferritin family protein [Magnetospirillum sp.]